MKKVAIYARVSTETQEQQKTIESQLEELREICKNFQVVREYVDNGWSGETLARPALDRLRDDAKKGLFEAVYVHSVDRLSRNLYQQGILVEELRRRGIGIFIKDKPIDDTPEGKFVFNILGAVAEFEKEKILERTRRGRLYKARTKGFVGYIPPYGYSYIKKTSEKEGKFVINKKEAQIVKLIFDLYLNFQSITRVQKELALRLIRPRRGGEKWSRSTIRDILRDETYIGTGYYAKYKSVEIDNGKKYKRRAKTGRRLRDRSEWIPVKFPPIIDKDKFSTVQDILSKRYKPFGKSKHFYLLSGLIRCKNCGSTFTGSESGGNLYYRCTNRRKRAPFPKDCNAKHMRARDLENAVWNAVRKVILNPQILTTYVLHLADQIAEDEEELNKKKMEALQEKRALNVKKKKLDELYFRGLKTIKEYEEQMKEFNQEENRINEKIRELETKLSQKINRPQIIRHIQYFCNLAKKRLQSLTPEEKQRFLRFLIDEIILDSTKKEAKIIGEIPCREEELQNLQNMADHSEKIGALSTLSRSRVQCSTNYLKFELEIKV
ncbi:MAG: recombinase family protein [Armatimonadetes bacterium]|nr:recombinase family protein [Armatimonadota bacterium]